MIKKLLIGMRTSIKLIVLLIISIFAILSLVVMLYNPIYIVTLNGEFLGYSGDKSSLQIKINEYMEKGDEQNENIAFAQLDALPEYKICLLKKGIETNDDEIFEKVKEQGTIYYKYYAILENSDEKAYVSTFEQAETVVNTLKEKKSTNINNITISEIYDTETKEVRTTEDITKQLYVEPVVVAEKPKTTKTKKTSSGKLTSSTGTSNKKVNLGITLIQPISGIITSRFGDISSRRSGAHTGLDIGAPKGTPIKVCASGTVTFAGTNGSYGKMIAVSHANGVVTYYAHCNALYARVGQTVSQGEVIAAVGSTGNSSGNHLHLEVRVNGITYNPQNYVY